MLKDISSLEWLRLIVSLGIFPGPGLAIISYLIKDRKFHIFSMIVLSIALSIGFWTIILAWCKIFSIEIIYQSVILIVSLLGWAIAIFRKINHLINTKHLFLESVIWAGVITSIIINIYSLRNMVAGLGSDSFHHTLITTLIINNHGIPSNYLPYFGNIITFNYHFGYHTFSAILSIISGIEPRVLILISGPILIGLSALSLSHFITEYTNFSTGSLVAAFIPALISVFPTAMLLWGRYPQLLGLFILPIFLSEYYRIRSQNSTNAIGYHIILISIISAGLLFTHYRVTFMAIIAVVIFELIHFIINFQDINLHDYLPTISIISLSLLFIMPWLLIIWTNLHKGYSIPSMGGKRETFYSIARLGENVLSYPTNNILIIIFLIFVVYELIKHDMVVLWLTTWSIVLLVSSRYFGRFSLIDPITVIISLYVPIAIIIGIGIYQATIQLNQKYQYALYLIIIFGSLICGKQLIGFLNNPKAAYVFPEDLKAAKWIKQHIPKDAIFMINTYQFEFSASLIIGNDAGGWLPLLANRRVVTYPMTFSIERFMDPTAIQSTIELHNIADNLASKEGVDLLQKNNINYIYIGERGGEINPANLLNSEYFTLLYNKKKIFIFQLSANN